MIRSGRRKIRRENPNSRMPRSRSFCVGPSREPRLQKSVARPGLPRRHMTTGAKSMAVGDEAVDATWHRHNRSRPQASARRSVKSRARPASPIWMRRSRFSDIAACTRTKPAPYFFPAESELRMKTFTSCLFVIASRGAASRAFAPTSTRIS